MGILLPIFYAIAITIFIFPKPQATHLISVIDEGVQAQYIEVKASLENERVQIAFDEIKENAAAFEKIVRLMAIEAAGLSRVEKVDVAELAGPELVAVVESIEKAPKPRKDLSQDFWNAKDVRVPANDALCLTADESALATNFEGPFTPAATQDLFESNDSGLCLEAPPARLEDTAPCCELSPDTRAIAAGNRP